MDALADAPDAGLRAKLLPVLARLAKAEPGRVVERAASIVMQLPAYATCCAEFFTLVRKVRGASG